MDYDLQQIFDEVVALQRDSLTKREVKEVLRAELQEQTSAIDRRVDGLLDERLRPIEEKLTSLCKELRVLKAEMLNSFDD